MKIIQRSDNEMVMHHKGLGVIRILMSIILFILGSLMIVVWLGSKSSQVGVLLSGFVFYACSFYVLLARDHTVRVKDGVMSLSSTSWILSDINEEYSFRDVDVVALDTRDRWQGEMPIYDEKVRSILGSNHRLALRLSDGSSVAIGPWERRYDNVKRTGEGLADTLGVRFSDELTRRVSYFD